MMDVNYDYDDVDGGDECDDDDDDDDDSDVNINIFFFNSIFRYGERNNENNLSSKYTCHIGRDGM
jgi:hypothetical protein